MAVKEKLDLSFLSGEETRAVLKVLERDKRLKMRDAERVGRLFPDRDVGQDVKNTLPLQDPPIWSTSLPAPRAPCAPLPVPHAALDAKLAPAKPAPLKPSLSLNTQTNTEGQHASTDKARGDGAGLGGAVKQPTLRSRLSSLLSIRFLQRDKTSKHKEAYANRENLDVINTISKTIDMGNGRSNADMGLQRITEIQRDTERLGLGTTTTTTTSNSSSSNRDMHTSSSSSSKDIHTGSRGRHSSGLHRQANIDGDADHSCKDTDFGNRGTGSKTDMDHTVTHDRYRYRYREVNNLISRDDAEDISKRDTVLDNRHSSNKDKGGRGSHDGTGGTEMGNSGSSQTHLGGTNRSCVIVVHRSSSCTDLGNGGGLREANILRDMGLARSIDMTKRDNSTTATGGKGNTDKHTLTSSTTDGNGTTHSCTDIESRGIHITQVMNGDSYRSRDTNTTRVVDTDLCSKGSTNTDLGFVNSSRPLQDVGVVSREELQVSRKQTEPADQPLGDKHNSLISDISTTTTAGAKPALRPERWRFTRTEASPAGPAQECQPASAPLSEGMSSSGPFQEQDRHKGRDGLSTPSGTMNGPIICVLEQKTTLGPKRTTTTTKPSIQQQSSLRTLVNSDHKDTDRPIQPTDSVEQITVGRSETPGSNVDKRPLYRGTAVTEEPCDIADKGHFPTTSDVSFVYIQKPSSLNFHSLRNGNGTEATNSNYCFSIKNQGPSTSDHSSTKVQKDCSVNEHCVDNGGDDKSSKANEGAITVTRIPSTMDVLAPAPVSPSIPDYSLAQVQKDCSVLGNQCVDGNAKTQQSVKGSSTTTCIIPPTIDEGRPAPVTLGCSPRRIPVWRSHLTHSLSLTDRPSTVPRSDSHPKSPGSTSDRSRKQLLLRAASADHYPASDLRSYHSMRSMSSSERINILAKQHAHTSTPGVDPNRPNQTSGHHTHQASRKPILERCYSTYDVSSSKHRHSPVSLNGTQDARPAGVQRSLSTLTLPQHGKVTDAYPLHSKLSVFRGDNQPHLRFRSHDNLLSQKSLSKVDLLDKANTDMDPIAVKSRSSLCHVSDADKFQRSEEVLTDIEFKEYRLTVSRYKVHTTHKQRWSSVSDLKQPKTIHRPQGDAFVPQTSVEHQRLFGQNNKTFTKPRQAILGSSGSQISLDWTSDDTDDDIFALPESVCTQTPLNGFDKHGKGVKPHHKSISNVHQINGHQTESESFSSFGLRRGHSFSITNVSSNRAAGPRRISTGSRTTTLADLRGHGEDYLDNAISHQPKTRSCSLDHPMSTGARVKRSLTTGHLWRNSSFASSLLSASREGLDSPWPLSTSYGAHLNSEDSDCDSVSEGEYYLHGQGDDLESPL